MLIEKVLKTARPYLEDRTVGDGVLGLSLIGIELDNGDIGLSYMLRDRLPAGCSAFGFAQEIIGENAYKVAQLAVQGKDDVQRGVGMAVITAGSRQLDLSDENDTDPCFGLDVNSGDIVGMIGFIPSVAKSFAKAAKEVVVFDKGLSASGGEYANMVKPMESQPKLLPRCDLMVVSGTTMINNTIDVIVGLSTGAREIVIVGSSTPMFPDAFKGSKVTVLSGSWWDNSKKDSLFKKISLSCGISHIKEFMIKKSVRVEG